MAQGGFGLVYKARHVSLKKAVAIKVLLVPDDLSRSARGDFVRQFLREAETIAAMDHPAIVRVLDSGVNTMPLRGDAPWIALDWIEGENLHEHLEARRGQGGRAPADALELLRPAFEALTYAHEMGIAHRDVKPGNLMLPKLTAPRAARGGPGLRLLDFGIAKLMEPEEVPGSGNTRTRSRYSSFSPDYAAAEQLSSLRTGPWCAWRDWHRRHELTHGVSEVVAEPRWHGEVRPASRMWIDESRCTRSQRHGRVEDSAGERGDDLLSARCRRGTLG